ncbi:MAG: response regulator [Bradyrhizobium sp.]|nr:response regulator [Bradyrhizobium sp.]
MAAPLLISIVDDDASLREALVRLVRSAGYEARDFGSAEHFLACGAVDTFACVITDIQMPGLSGLELGRLLQQEIPRIPVIMITARAEPNLKDEAHASGAACFLRKPFEPNALIDCLERLIGLPA